jgi:hypothetical protein
LYFPLYLFVDHFMKIGPEMTPFSYVFFWSNPPSHAKTREEHVFFVIHTSFTVVEVIRTQQNKY